MERNTIDDHACTNMKRNTDETTTITKHTQTAERKLVIKRKRGGVVIESKTMRSEKARSKIERCRPWLLNERDLIRDPPSPSGVWSDSGTMRYTMRCIRVIIFGIVSSNTRISESQIHN